MSHDLLYCKDFFDMQHNEAGQKGSSINQMLLKCFLFMQKDNQGQILPQFGTKSQDIFQVFMHVIDAHMTLPFFKIFQILYIFAQISKYFGKIAHMSLLTRIGPELFNLISHDLSQRFSLKHFCMMEHSRQAIVTLVSFHRKPVTVQMGNLIPVWATLYRKQLCLMICSLRILKCGCMMGFNIQTKVMLASLPKKFPSNQG